MPLQNALRDVECERPEMQQDVLRPLHFSEQASREGKSILSGERVFFFPYFSFGRKRKNGRDECRETLFTKDFHL